jgi:flagellar M-ring protein FliF
MGEFIEKLRRQVMDFAAGLSTRMKILIAAGGAAVLILIALLVFMFTRVEYVPLAQDVTLEQASNITTKLDELGVKWKDEKDTSQILVEKNSLSKARMALAVEGLMSEKNYNWTDVFATNSLTMTSEEKNKMYLIAQASTLSASLESINGIENAIVNLYIPNDSNYLITEGVESKASVILKLEDDKALTEKQVNGILMVLVNSVKGLVPERVSIVDSNGNELNKSGQDTDDFAMETQFDMKTAVEDRLNTRLHEMLATLYGKDNVKVMTSVKLDFDSVTTVSKAFSPSIEGESNGMLRSVTEITEDVVNGTTATGAPGTDSNTETTNYNESVANTTNNIKNSSKTLNYELNEINTQVTKAKGQIADVTVGIIVNTDALVDNVLTEEHKTEVTALINSAMGLETKKVNVTAAKFADPNADMAVVSNLDKTSQAFPVWIFALIAVLIAAAVAVFIMLKKNKEKAAQAAADEAARAAALAQEQKELEEIQLELEDKSSPKYQIEKFIETNPEAVAQLLRNWLNEE